MSQVLHQCEREIEADSASTPAWTTPEAAMAKGENEADRSASSPDPEAPTTMSENEANSTSSPLEVDPPAPDPAVPQPAPPAADLPPVIAAAEQWLAAGYRTATGSGSVEDEVRALQALAGHISARQ